MSGAIVFPVRKRRANAEPAAQLLSNRIARRKLPGGKCAPSPRPPVAPASSSGGCDGIATPPRHLRHVHSPLHVREDGGTSDDSLSRASPATVDGREELATQRLQGAAKGNSLHVLRESASPFVQQAWRVDATAFELHTPKLVRRQRAIGGSRGLLVLPALEVRPSPIPHGGLGVFAVKSIKKGTWLTEYGGEIIDNEEARRRRTCGDDTHIRSCGYMERCIDARVRACWDIDYYVRHHMVGGFFNDAHGTGKPVNTAYVTTEMRLGYQHPYEVSRSLALSLPRCLPSTPCPLFLSPAHTYRCSRYRHRYT